MKKLILLALFVVQPTFAAPFVVADVVAGVTQCGVYFNAQPKTTVAVTAGECKFDVGGVPPGSHVVKMTAITVSDPVWGTQESVQSAPFSFTRPYVPAVPDTLRLAP